MNRILMAFAPAGLLAASIAWPADLPESCANIKWNAAFLKDYPNAPVTCQEVTVKDGVKYAKFYGKVSKVDHQSVQVAISDVGNFPK
jgi:hypothetical protein